MIVKETNYATQIIYVNILLIITIIVLRKFKIKRLHRVATIDLKNISNKKRLIMHEDEDPFNQFIQQQILSYCNDKMKMFKFHAYKGGDLADCKDALVKYIHNDLLLIVNIEYDYKHDNSSTTRSSQSLNTLVDAGTFTSSQLIQADHYQ